MRIEYANITSVFSDPVKGCQLCHCKGIITACEYQNCEIITPRWVNYLPKIGDVVAICELHNSEIIVIGILDQFDLDLLEWETMLHQWDITKGQIDNYNMKTKVKLNKNSEIEIYKWETIWKDFKPTSLITLDKNNNISIITQDTDANQKASITINADGTILLNSIWKISLTSDTKIELMAPLVEVI